MSEVNLRLRKFTALMLLLLASVTLNAQVTSKVTLDISNQPLTSVLKSIEKQTPCRFSYKDVVVDKVKSVSVKCVNVNVTKALDMALKGTKLTYEVVSPKSIVIVEKKQKAATSPTPRKKKSQAASLTVTVSPW